MKYYTIKSKKEDLYVSGLIPQTNEFRTSSNKSDAMPFTIEPTEIMKQYDKEDKFSIQP